MNKNYLNNKVIFFLCIIPFFNISSFSKDIDKRIGVVTSFRGKVEINRNNKKINNNLLGLDIYSGDKIFIDKGANLNLINIENGNLTVSNGKKIININEKFTEANNGKLTEINIPDAISRLDKMEISSHGLADTDPSVIGPTGKISSLEPNFYFNFTQQTFVKSKSINIKIYDDDINKLIWEKDFLVKKDYISYPNDKDPLEYKKNYKWEAKQGKNFIKGYFETLDTVQAKEVQSKLASIDNKNPSYNFLVANIYKSYNLYFESLPFFIKLSDSNKLQSYPYQELVIVYNKLNLSALAKEEKLKLDSLE